MIRGPVLPQLRDSLWSLVSARLDRIESGLTLVLEGLDCADGQLGLVDGLARDAVGAPVLILLAVEGDALLPARALAAGQFLQRVGDALAGAVPEASFCASSRGRIVVIGTESAGTLLAHARRLPIEALEVCSLEPFRIAGSERFAIRWLPPSASPVAAAMELPADPAAREGADSAKAGYGGGAFVVPPSRAEQWEQLRSICERIDPAVVLSGDRYSRRITWNGHPLGEVRTSGGALLGRSATGVSLDLKDLRDVRRFGDQLLRAFVAGAGLDLASVSPSSPRRQGHEPHDDRSAAARHAANGRASVSSGSAAVAESLRSSLAAARLSPEEYSAFEEPASVVGSDVEGTFVAEDRKQASPSAPPSVERD